MPPIHRVDLVFDLAVPPPTTTNDLEILDLIIAIAGS